MGMEVALCGGGLGEYWPWWGVHIEAWLVREALTPPGFQTSEAARASWGQRLVIYRRADDRARRQLVS